MVVEWFEVAEVAMAGYQPATVCPQTVDVLRGRDVAENERERIGVLLLFEIP